MADYKLTLVVFLLSINVDIVPVSTCPRKELMEIPIEASRDVKKPSTTTTVVATTKMETSSTPIISTTPEMEASTTPILSTTAGMETSITPNLSTAEVETSTASVLYTTTVMESRTTPILSTTTGMETSTAPNLSTATGMETSIAPNPSTTTGLETPVTSECGFSKYFKPDGAVPGGAIVGGSDAEINEYPWIVFLELVLPDGETSSCGGSIIDESWILTAAHCLVDESNVKIGSVTAYFGSHNTSTWMPDEISLDIVNADDIILHASYNATTYFNDIALLRLPSRLNFSYSWNVQKICLPTSCSDDCPAGTLSFIAGWGYLEYGGEGATILQTARVPIANNTKCFEQYGASFNETLMLCAGYDSGGIDSCQGDSGGPMMSNDNGYFKQCGVVSFGIGCANADYFGIYARVCTFLDWIHSYTGPID